MIREQKKARLPPVNGNASLLIYVSRGVAMAGFVHWPNDIVKYHFRSLSGREVRVDGNKFVFSVAANFPLVAFMTPHTPDGVHYITLLADAGEKMRQVRRGERPLVSDLGLRALDMCRVALARKAVEPGTASADPSSIEMTVSSAMPCFVCKKTSLPLATCSARLTTSHASCLSLLEKYSADHGAMTSLALPRVSFSWTFRQRYMILMPID